ncbi:uncharacterized protein LOC108090527 [Drosophila ficusphila]|uniref:uncharacterized protein LOC108090527 n=1 Tax=Drosophila ficusphila TaxID=30025 RepID=UPI0007E77F09|nr:uncharacterized protein LOC108090527 [Drosophila ficusphila]
MKNLLIVTVWMFSCSCSSALVHYIKLEKGANGCKSPKGAEMAVGDTEQDDKSCGAISCHSTEGDAFVHFCQIPAKFAECAETAVLTEVDFPECCWICAAWKECKGGEGGEGGEGEAPAEGEGEPAQRAPKFRTKGTKGRAPQPRTEEADRKKSKESSQQDEFEIVGGDENIKFGGGSPISKFGEESL